MKAILRNLMSVFRRYKLAATLNMLGLSVAFAAFMVIMIQLDYDFGFDKFHTDSDKIFRLEMSRHDPGFFFQAPFVSRPLAERFFESSPHIVAGGMADFAVRKRFFHVENDGVRNYFEENSIRVTSGFFDVFTFDFVEGSKETLQTPGSIIIPNSLAYKLFGNELAIGKQMFYENENRTVGAVYRDFPSNTIINNCTYISMPEDENTQRWGISNYHAFIRVNQSSDISQVIDNFKRNFDVQGNNIPILTEDESNARLRLTALPDIHFATDLSYDDTPKASRQTLLILLTIAIVIVVIAAINYTNFSTALTPVRVKSINTQRVLGAQRNTIRIALIFEAAFFSFMSYLVALWLVSFFQDSQLKKLVEADLSFGAHPLIYGGTALVAFLVGILAGVYPARYMTSFAPALVLKGSFGLSHKGKALRHTLTGIQYVASFILIIGASFMYLQNRFMLNSPLGYDKENIITVNISMLEGCHDAFTDRIKAYSGVEDVTNSTYILSSTDNYSQWAPEYRGEWIRFSAIPVHYNFLKVMGIEVNEGRDFRQEDMQEGAFIFNESALQKYNLELGTTVNGCDIVGFIPDLKFASFRTVVEPMAFFVHNDYPRNIACIKLKEGAKVRDAMSYIQATLAEFDANYAFYEVRFFDEVMQRLYEKEIALSSLISLFSLIAIFIAMVGVFGLVVFDSECRRKEIGIRKVFGASITDIIFMFNKMYFRILAVCFVIAVPLAWYAVHQWFQNFAYKTPMHWWVYLLAFVAVGVITAGTVTFQNWRVANENPAKTIMKCE